MKLIIAEKPSLGRTIASAVGACSRKDGYIEGNGYIVSWCFGHLYELAAPERYWDADHQKGGRVSWEQSMSHLPFFPDDWKFLYEPKQECRKQIRILKGLINSPDTDLVYAAGDADREGEVIVRLVLEANMKKPKKVLRIWLSSLTDEVIRKAIVDAKPYSAYESLYRAGRTRAAIDWMIGIELTRFASVKAKRFIRIGRCICPIVARIVEREKEIRDFVPEKYFAVVGTIERNGLKMVLTCKKRLGKDEKSEAEMYAGELNKLPTIVTGIEKQKVQPMPEKLFSMSALQSSVCKSDKKIKPADVLAAAQSLYENGFLTYPRTGSRYLCRDEAERISEVIAAFQRKGYPDLVNKPQNAQIYDDGRVESHSAITPTRKMPEDLHGTEKIVYECVRNRFMAVFSAVPCIVERIVLTVTCGDEMFKIKDDVLIQEGWQRFEKTLKKDSDLPEFEKGEILFPGYTPAAKRTTPPKRYTVESLNNWMLVPAKTIDEDADHTEYSDEEWKDILSEATICTEATRADIIDRCIKSNYITLSDGNYSATDYGFYLIDVMRELGIDLTVSRTVGLSKDRHDISIGRKTESEVLESTKEMLVGIMKPDAHVKYSAIWDTGGEVIGNCPICGEPIRETHKAFSCTSSGCRFSLWKENRYFKAVGAKITKSRAKALLKNGRFLAKGLKSRKSEKVFDAYICMDGLDDKGNIKWRMEFPRNQQR